MRLCLAVEGVVLERFSGLCTMRQKGDGRVSIPPRSAFWGAFWGTWQCEDRSHYGVATSPVAKVTLVTGTSIRYRGKWEVLAGGIKAV